MYKKLKNGGRLLECYVKGGDDYRAALMYEKDGDLPGAMEAFTRFAQSGGEQAGLLKEEIIQAVLKNHLLKAAVRSFAIGQYGEAASFFYKKRLYHLAAPLYQTLGDHKSASDCFYNLDDFYQAALEIEQSSLADKWVEAAELLSFYLGRGRRDPRKEQKLLQEGEQFLKEGDPDRALVRFKSLDAAELIRQAYHQTGRDQEALEYFLSGNRLEEAAQYLGKAALRDIRPDFIQAVLYDYFERDVSTALRRQAEVFVGGLLARLLEGGTGIVGGPWWNVSARSSISGDRTCPKPFWISCSKPVM